MVPQPSLVVPSQLDANVGSTREDCKQRVKCAVCSEIHVLFCFFTLFIAQTVVEVLDEIKELKMGHLKSRSDPRKKRSV